MDNACFVHGVERIEQRMAEVDELILGERAVVAHIVRQRLPVDELGDDERLGGLKFGVEDRCDPRMLNPPQCPHLTGEPLAGGLVVGDVRVQHFDGDRVVLSIHPEVDDAHAAGTEFIQQPVAAEFLYCHSTQVS